MAAASKAPAKKPAAKRTPTKKPTAAAPDNPWDQLTDESGPAYEAFLAYRDLGLARSNAKVARELGKSTTLMNRWSSRHSWVLRASAWDRELDREWLLEQRQQRRDSAKLNAKLARAAFGKAAQGLSSLATGEMDANAIARLMDAASKLERLALGESTENVQVSGPGGGAIAVADVSILTDEERHARLLELRAELDRQLGSSGDEGAAA
ncbi:hypothetical protein [Aeromicrobium sp. Leaf291]|uniref:hypothetical protein n=1 Tax=Aeromicrobium sp. Leaf291 TaxID=1736325 RepID=UPI0006F8E04C|nr:hypothetical protein [Aeromicrobium sp. Leaf291]KQP81618.1 hypothetical protein ASF35_16435 [Aeromicrobium sp. Leaf291]